ncbi:MAG TPA: sigma-70 family RNA polymerase sigma factor, partial [Kofleriaceae bacterium]
MSEVAVLLAEADWLTRLARSLVGNDDADDIVQETYVAALKSPPDPDRSARPWLRRVMVNVVRMRHRGRVRRDLREQRSGEHGETVWTPAQLLERARTERALADLVIALGEPLRSTVLLRYREGLSAEAIAEQQHVAVATVRRRLKEAVDRLRAGMDDDFQTWRAAFAPFLVGRRARPPWWSMIMAKAGTKIAIVAIAALLLLLGAGLVIHERGSGNVDQSSTAVVTSRSSSPERVLRTFVQPGIAAISLSGRVTAADRPYAGAKVRVTHAYTRELVGEAISDDAGRFSIPSLPGAALVVSATADDKVALPIEVDLRSPIVRGKAVELRLLGCVHLRGIIIDGSGAPIAHARVAAVVAPVPFADTDELGRYDLCTHAGPQLLRFAASGYHAIQAELHLTGDFIQDVTLLPEAIVAGVVLDPAGLPVADAAITIDPRGKNSLQFALSFARSGADGRFRISGVAPGRSQIFAEAPGQASRHLDLVVGAGETREQIVLKLEAAPRLVGKVVDSQHRPISGAAVGLRSANNYHERLAITQADGSFVLERA